MKPFLLAAAVLLAPSLPPQSGWEAGWTYRRKIVLRNHLEGDLKAGYPVQIEFDPAYLGLSGKAAADLKDLALLHGGKPVPIAIVPGRTESSRAIWFRTPADVRAGAADEGFLLYYGNASGAGLRTGLETVFDLHEDFASPSSKFEIDRDIAHAVENGALVIKDVPADRTEHAPARILFKTLPSTPGFSVSFDLEVEIRPQTPVTVSLTVDFQEPGQNDAALARKIDDLIDKLGEFDWQVREKATKDLIEVGKPAAAKLQAAAKSTDAEVRWRVDHVLKEIREKGASPTIAAGVRAGEGSAAHPVQLVSQIGAARSRTAIAGVSPVRFRITLLRDPDGEVVLLWNQGRTQSGRLKGTVHQIYLAIHKAAAAPLPGVKIDNVSVRRYVGEDGRPTHTIDLEETKP